MVGDSVAVKERIVEQDPHEHGIRKALNLGHTFGHAFESWALKRKPVLHGYAVAFGLIPELYLSVMKTGFPTEKMRQTVNFIKEYYGSLPITCDDYDELIELMRHDKKIRMASSTLPCWVESVIFASTKVPPSTKSKRLSTSFVKDKAKAL